MSSTAIVPSSQTLTQTAAGQTRSSPLSANLQTLKITPKKNAPPAPTTPTRMPGHAGWIHPRMDEVLRRRNATDFDGSNVKTIIISSLIILTSMFVPNLLREILPTPWLHAIYPWPMYALWAIRLLFLAFIGVAAAPLLRTPDACEDIPLTPQQRKLLGLPPMSRPATPQEQEQYVTPPRFSRSNTPRSSSSSIRAEVSGSPLSGRGTPMESASFLRSGSGSPFGSAQRPTSVNQSPQYSALRSGGERRRLSYTSDRSSPLSESLFDTSGSTSTPTKSNKTSLGLNNKWLYEKGRGTPRSPANTSRSSLFT
ncbi:Nucleoporin POM34 [Lecanosticta acicola]|uniref:Nucleoporin POM34 n=1 Tax=Lecanosticta acicola TaxID=111012 RepID=A0AAI8Z1Z3_9PEZI|nr:Nucleoporin POM34 [Lecanosticta acicola]